MASFPKGFFDQPSVFQKRKLYSHAYRILGTGLGGLLVVLTYYIFAWWVVGRDPPDGTIYPIFEPPLGLPPACVRYLRRMAYDKKCFTAALIHMAVKGHLKINETLGQFTLQRTDHTQRRTCPPLSPGEKKIFKVLLSSHPSLVLKDSNHAKISKAIEKLGDWLSKEYERKLFFKNRWWLVPGWLLSALTMAAAILTVGGTAGLLRGVFMFFLLFLLTIWCVAMAKDLIPACRHFLLLLLTTPGKIRSFVGALLCIVLLIPLFFGYVYFLFWISSRLSIWIVPLFIGLVAINWSFWHWLKRPTAKGQHVLDQIAGFRMYLETAEGEFLQQLNPPELTPELFEKYLPYALALDVENAWSEKFSNVLELSATAPSGNHGYHPDWYHGTDHHHLTTGNFVSNLDSSISTAVSSASTAPGSSSGGGGGGW